MLQCHTVAAGRIKARIKLSRHAFARNQVEVLLCYIMPKPGKGLTELATGKSINYSDPLYLIFSTVTLNYQEIFFFDSLFYNNFSVTTLHNVDDRVTSE
jgi:hypothetical protein